MSFQKQAEEMRSVIRDQSKRLAIDAPYQHALSFPDDELILRVLLGRLTSRAGKDDFDVDGLDGDRWLVVTNHTAGEDTAYLLVSAFGTPPKGTLLVELTGGIYPLSGRFDPRSRLRAHSFDRPSRHYWFEDERLALFVEAAMHARATNRVRKIGF